MKESRVGNGPLEVSEPRDENFKELVNGGPVRVEPPRGNLHSLFVLIPVQNSVWNKSLCVLASQNSTIFANLQSLMLDQTGDAGSQTFQTCQK